MAMTYFKPVMFWNFEDVRETLKQNVAYDNSRKELMAIRRNLTNCIDRFADTTKHTMEDLCSEYLDNLNKRNLELKNVELKLKERESQLKLLEDRLKLQEEQQNRISERQNERELEQNRREEMQNQKEKKIMEVCYEFGLFDEEEKEEKIDEETIEVSEILYKGKSYLIDTNTNIVYDYKTHNEIGKKEGPKMIFFNK
jgi:hypothetical protein